MTELEPFFVEELVLFRCAFPPRLEVNLGSFYRNSLLRKGFPDNLYSIKWDVVDWACLEDRMSLL